MSPPPSCLITGQWEPSSATLAPKVFLGLSRGERKEQNAAVHPWVFLPPLLPGRWLRRGPSPGSFPSLEKITFLSQETTVKNPPPAPPPRTWQEPVCPAVRLRH